MIYSAPFDQEGREPTFSRRRVSLPGQETTVCGELGNSGLGILFPLPYGVVLEGLERTFTQKAFLQTIAAGNHLIAYEQRKAGAPARHAQPGWNELGADVWAAADANGIERAVLYGVFDGGYTAAYAAVQQPDRVLGMILNFVPLAMAGAEGEGVPPEMLQRWFGDDFVGPKDRAQLLLLDSGIDEEDAETLATSWVEEVDVDAAKQREGLLRAADLRPLLPQITAPVLVLEPRERDLFRGWGEAVGSQLRNARVVHPARASEAIGAIHGFLAVRRSVVGRDASRLSPALSRIVEEGERSVSTLTRILVAVDDSLASARAVELACRMGELQQAELVLACVVEVPRTLPLDTPEPASIRQGERALQLSSAIVSEHGLHYRTLLRPYRDVAGGIVKLADEEKANLIVMPNFGGETAATGMGEVAREVLRRAHCEVFVDRQDLDRPEEGRAEAAVP